MKTNEKKLSKRFYMENRPELLAPKLLGKILKTNIDGKLCGGRIVEVEAYCGLRDRACHAFNGKTKRNEILFAPGSFAYVYLCYGIHRLFNVVTGDPSHPCAILIRALEPVFGREHMEERRGFPSKIQNISNGPGKCAQAMGIELSHNGLSLLESRIWIEKDPRESRPVLAGPRIGIDYAGEDKHLPWRFALMSDFLSKSAGLDALPKGRV